MPRPETPGFPSKIHISSITNTIPPTCTQVFNGLSRILEAIPLREPTLMGRICIRRNMGKIVETPIPRTRTCVEDAAAKKTHSHTSERQGYEADQERQVKRERGSIRNGEKQTSMETTMSPGIGGVRRTKRSEHVKHIALCLNRTARLPSPWPGTERRGGDGRTKHAGTRKI